MPFHHALTLTFPTCIGLSPVLIPRHGNSHWPKLPHSSFVHVSESGNGMPKSELLRRLSISSSSLTDIVVSHGNQPAAPNATAFPELGDAPISLQNNGSEFPEKLRTLLENFHGLVLADLDPATAKLAIGIVGPFLSVFGFLFILRIVMSWYPKLPVNKFPYVLAYAPTEPLLIPTRKIIPPVGGVDVTPVVWFGLLSFLNEILVGPQGLLVLVSQQV